MRLLKRLDIEVLSSILYIKALPNLEGTSLKENRLINIILLVTLAYSSAVFQGTEIQKKQVQKYVSRQKKPSKKYRIRSIFGVGLDGE